MDKYGMIEEMQKKMEVLADAKGAFRCGLIWDVVCGLKALRDNLQSEDATNAQKIEAMKNSLKALQEGKEDGKV